MERLQKKPNKATQPDIARKIRVKVMIIDNLQALIADLIREVDIIIDQVKKLKGELKK